MSQPFFSIGVTTYNRQDLLKECICSILQQTFSDFEVIIGNDYSEKLTLEDLGISDPRVRIVNYEENMGELNNMNVLLKLGRGKYFTWQFDDDLYSPSFLEIVYSLLVKNDFPLCAFTSFRCIYGRETPNIKCNIIDEKKIFSGCEFLERYLSGEIRAMGCTGIYNTDYLRKNGGVKRLGRGPFALYSEYLLLIQSGLVDEVVYINAPLVFYRVHDSSWSCTNTQAEEYKYAGENLLKESIVMLTSSLALRSKLEKNLFHILKLILNNYVIKFASSSKTGLIKEVDSYFWRLIEEHIQPLNMRHGLRFSLLQIFSLRLVLLRLYIKQKLKMCLPVFIFRYAHFMRSRI